MKTLQVFGILLVFLIQTALSEPRWYTASDGKRYLIEKESEYNWYQAWHECARQNAQLVAIDTKEKNSNIEHLFDENFLSFDNLWIGGNDAFGDRQDILRPFYWSATGEEFSFTNWARNQPDNFRFKEHCVHIVYDSFPAFKWNDNSCHNAEMGFICEEKSATTDRFKETNNKLQDGANEENTNLDSQNDNNKEQEQQYTDKEKISQDPEVKLTEHQAVEKLHPKLLAGVFMSSKTPATVDGADLVLNNNSENKRKWRGIIKGSLRKTELDIFGSLFTLEKDVDKVTGEE